MLSIAFIDQACLKKEEEKAMSLHEEMRMNELEIEMNSLEISECGLEASKTRELDSEFWTEPDHISDIPRFDELDLEELIRVGIVDDELIDDSVGEDAYKDDLYMAMPMPVRGKTIGERAVRLAIRQKGYREQGGPDCNKFSRYFGHRCQPWCADFVSWALDAAGHQNKQLPWDNPSLVTSIYAWGKKHRSLVEAPRPGDIFLIRNKRASHAGFVVSVQASRGTFTSIEGNTMRGKDRRLLWVWSHRREMKRFKFVRPTSLEMRHPPYK